MPAAVMWFRRDLRLADNPALLAAAAEAGDAGVLGLFVLDPVLLGPAGPPRRAVLLRSLRALDAALGGALVVRGGDPEQLVPAAAAEVGARTVHCAADYGVHGRWRDRRVAQALDAGGRALATTGSPWTVAPGRLRTAQDTPFRVYTPYARAWRAHGWRAPAPAPPPLPWLRRPTEQVPADPDLAGVALPDCGEAAATAAWERFRADRLAAYGEQRDQPAAGATSELSMHLKYGTLHPRTLLAGLDGSEAAQRFRRELAWRDFYADVLWHVPGSARTSLLEGMAGLRVDEGDVAAARFTAWAEGRTGYPLVDAGMRQLRAEAWLHNRVRMVTASFLVKDLHLPWQRGARHFMTQLRDGELSSNSHGWQWVAGTGTDAAPYHRVLNPTVQAERFDPDGDYVRRYVPELRGLAGKAVHRPWDAPGGSPAGYPAPVVDHAAERREALDRLAEVGG